MRIRLVSTIGLAMIAQAAQAQDAVPPDPATQETTSAEIIVRGNAGRGDETTRNRAAVGQIGRPVPTGGFEAQYGRWKDIVCVAVAGLSPDTGQYIADRIGQVARDVGLTPQGASCKPNIVIVVTRDPRAFIDLSRNAQKGPLVGIDHGTIEQMRRSEAPVRWGGLNATMGAQGDSVEGDGTGGSGRSSTLKVWGSSRIMANTKIVMQRMVVIVDSQRIEGMKIGTLASYLAMVSLAQLRPNADAPMVNTILSAFRKDADTPDDLSDFDRAYLKALYTIPMNRNGTLQRQALVGAINDSRRSEATGEPKP